MATLIPTGQRASFQNAYENFFDTFSGAIIIFKEAKKTIISTSSVVLPGYREESDESNYTLETVSGIFPAVILQKEKESEYLDATNDQIPMNEVRIKVREDARRYINEGKTEAIKIGDIYFNTVSNEVAKTFLDITHYVYLLKRTH